ncbi:MAG: hypothetical protein H6705_12600 [Myxococcales bacterium]|nr:hypothetical protein [Myxococcales bacterium]
MIRFSGAALALALGALGALTGCDSFPAACEGHGDCPDAALCEQGECLAVAPELLARCRGGAAGDELCNGDDDDCDGATDEGCGPGDVCVAGDGICAREGYLQETPLGLVCSADPGAALQERCNAIDDDCDGATDEVCRDGDTCEVGRGGCRREGLVTIEAGRVGCVGNGGRPLVAGAPRDEVCGDRVDDDCDGAVDEGFETLGTACAVGEGICRNEGEYVCVGGAVRCSADPGRAESERCNERDDDCDGSTDEGFGVGERCEVGTGACASSTLTTCNPAGDGVRCTAVAGQPSVEDCNGIDDDCDGDTDEGADGAQLLRACGTDVGVCRPGVERCVDGFWGACEGGVRPAAREACDNLDNDCDGAVDGHTEPCGSEVGTCRLGTRACAAGVWSACNNSIEPTPERCDGLDNDCDGTVDEADGSGIAGSYSEICGSFEGGECRRGARTCGAGGVLGPCVGARDPVEERCDGLDNDCDGDLDETFPQLGTPCSVGMGPCRSEGVRVCDAGGGGTTCDAVPAAGSPETCDGADEDCDGRIDEGFFLGAACLDGAGRAGVCTCNPQDAVVCSVGGVLRAALENGANGRDDDCDGRVDEG